ncbi:MAG: ribosome assembly RNA-binding protein YhbY [Clostridiales bacterium]|nr:ribosome assembly RNA-binding protein YhbY [Clostridiales bacterium]MBE6046010.1 ribosome assembly RNA-binding protein YhbY [Clostridiales bacterium]
MITGKQRSYLRKLGQELDPVVFIGKNDVTETVIKELDKNLTAHELVKVKIQEGSILDAKPVANELAEMLDAEFVQAIGRKFVLYRQAPEKEDRKIVLPR